jgi:hypothetical protein
MIKSKIRRGSLTLITPEEDERTVGQAVDRPPEPEPRPEEIWFAARLQTTPRRGVGKGRSWNNFLGRERGWLVPFRRESERQQRCPHLAG